MLYNNGAMHTSLSNERFCTAKIVISFEVTKGFCFFLAQRNLSNSKTLNFFVKSNEQYKTCFSIAMTRKSHINMKLVSYFYPRQSLFWLCRGLFHVFSLPLPNIMKKTKNMKTMKLWSTIQENKAGLCNVSVPTYTSIDAKYLIHKGLHRGICFKPCT